MKKELTENETVGMIGLTAYYEFAICISNWNTESDGTLVTSFIPRLFSQINGTSFGDSISHPCTKVSHRRVDDGAGYELLFEPESGDEFVALFKMTHLPTSSKGMSIGLCYHSDRAMILIQVGSVHNLMVFDCEVERSYDILLAYLNGDLATQLSEFLGLGHPFCRASQKLTAILEAEAEMYYEKEVGKK